MLSYTLRCTFQLKDANDGVLNTYSEQSQYIIIITDTYNSGSGRVNLWNQRFIIANRTSGMQFGLNHLSGGFAPVSTYIIWWGGD